MSLVGNEVKRSIAELGVRARPVDVPQRDLLRSRVEARYSPRSHVWPIWEASRFQAAVQDAQGWQRISEYVGTAPCYLMFNPDDCADVFFFESGEDLVKVLEDTFGFEFYVTDEDAAFLICFNHHDMLLASGGAADWLLRRKAVER